MQVRHVAAPDASAWAEQRAELWPDADREELAAEAAAFLDGQHDPTLQAVLVAEAADGRVAGFVELSLRPYAEGCSTTPVAFLEGWYVVPELRGGGVGRELVAAAEAWARAQGCRELASDTELDNTASASAHLALGFEEVEVIRCFRKAIDGGGDAHAPPAS